MESIRKATLKDKEHIHRLLEALEETSLDYGCFRDIFEANLSDSSIF